MFWKGLKGCKGSGIAPVNTNEPTTLAPRTSIASSQPQNSCGRESPSGIRRRYREPSVVADAQGSIRMVVNATRALSSRPQQHDRVQASANGPLIAIWSHGTVNAATGLGPNPHDGVKIQSSTNGGRSSLDIISPPYPPVQLIMHPAGTGCLETSSGSQGPRCRPDYGRPASLDPDTGWTARCPVARIGPYPIITTITRCCGRPPMVVCTGTERHNWGSRMQPTPDSRGLTLGCADFPDPS